MENGSWKPNIYKDFNDWEVTLAMALLNSLQKERVSSELDKISWKGPIGCSFSVSKVVKVLSPRGTPLQGHLGSLCSHQSNFFAWEAEWGKILTLDKLQRRGWHLSNRCYLCGRNEESTHHILLHYPMVSRLWVLFFSLVGLSWVLPKTVKEALLSWKGSFVGKKKKKKHVEIYST